MTTTDTRPAAPDPTGPPPGRRTSTEDGGPGGPDRRTGSWLPDGVGLTLAGLLATLFAAAALLPLLDGLGWTLPVLVVVLAVVLTGFVARRLSPSWAVAVLAQSAVLVVVLTALFARDQALLRVLPGPAALQALAVGLREGGQVIGSQAAPVPAGAGITLLVTLGVGVVALLVDLLAAGLQRPAAAGLALLAVYCVPATVLPDGVGWGYFLLAGLGYLILISSDALDRVRGWGQMLGGGDDGRGVLEAGPMSGGRRVAAVALAAAVLIPLVTPGLDSQLLNRGDGAGAGRGSGRINVINPILGLRDDLRSRSNTPVITYRTTVAEPAPLRIATDDVFDGETWAPSTGPISRTQRVQEGLPNAPGLSDAVARTTETTSISIGALSETYLPLPYPTTKVDIEGEWLYENISLNVVGDGQRTENLQYVAQHLVVEPTRDQLENAPAAPQELRETFTELPQGLAPEIRSIASERAGEGSNYQKALRLQNWLRDEGGFTYDENAPGSDGTDSGTDAVLLFLQQKRGYCVQFASSMAVMARTLGIPTRVAVGFLPGTDQGDGTYQITLRDAHAWPELYFQGVGWTRFEPTPASRTGNLPGYAQEEQPATAEDPQTAATPSASAAPSVQQQQAERPDQTDQTVGQEQGGTSWWQRIPWRVLALLALLALLASLPVLAVHAYRRLRWSGARDPARAAETGWEELRERLDDLGVRWVGSWTPRAAAHRLEQDHGLDSDAGQGMRRLAGAVESARYAPPGQETGRPAAEVRQDVDQVIRAVAVGRSAGDRRRATWWPRSGFSAIGRLAAMPFTAFRSRRTEPDDPALSDHGASGRREVRL